MEPVQNNSVDPQENSSTFEKYKETFDKAAEHNKEMLKQVETQINLLKGFMGRLEEGREEIDKAELQIARLAHKLNHPNS